MSLAMIQRLSAPATPDPVDEGRGEVGNKLTGRDVEDEEKKTTQACHWTARDSGPLGAETSPPRYSVRGPASGKICFPRHGMTKISNG